MRVGIEVGGTFTDLVAMHGDQIVVLKVPSTPASPDVGALQALLESGLPIDAIDELAHGSTVATNAVLERKGFKIAFLTTAGFRDVLLLQRHGRSRIYDLQYQKPVPVVERADTFEIPERLGARGEVITPLDVEAVRRDVLPQLQQGDYSAIAVCLLNAYVNPAHELALQALLEEALPEIHVTISSDVTREFREYERASTATLSAYVQPIMDRYITRFHAALQEYGFQGNFSVMQSNGGRVASSAIRQNAVSTLLSGPAAGVMGAVRQAAQSGYHDLITLDIGGTSTDVCVVTAGQPQLANEFTIDGLPVRIPVIDINTVGAGGGSIIWIDDGGMLRVGPHSAGAHPGPACYRQGGNLPTITDAHVVRKTIQPGARLGGSMQLCEESARQALIPIADHFGMTVEAAADSAIKLANSNIVRAIQLLSTERGKDPRDYALIAYGGAGPLHAASVADDLGMTRLIIPPSPGVISAYGLLASDFVQFDSLTRPARVDDAAPDLIRSIFSDMKQQATSKLQQLNLEGVLEFTLVIEMRFVGQAFEVPITLPEDTIKTLDTSELKRYFSDAHHAIYHFGADLDKVIEMISYKLKTTLPNHAHQSLRRQASSDDRLKPTLGQLYENRAWCHAKCFQRDVLDIGESCVGPILIEDSTSTFYLPSGWVVEVDAANNMIARKSGG